MEQTPETQPTTAKIPLWKKGWFKNLMTVVIFVLVYLSIRPFMQGDVVQGSVPHIQIQTITGETIDLKSIDRPTLIHIWATWCPICGVAKSGIESIADDYPVINIATQSGDDEQLLSYAQQNDMKPQIIVNDLDGQILKRFGAKAVPADFIVDANGEIQFVEVGFTTELGLRLRLWWAGL